ncbi:DNA-directed RNA polymerase family protein [Striga asiatica]|uniref:DNA-directed RNA polymerase family protein n=1 Tax=Striga asiatica TaxID=4170 RepID=A0A5A7QZ69_STRAF|nr:DNA-directed RNA polymerase family protein [Striga asiatica]
MSSRFLASFLSVLASLGLMDSSGVIVGLVGDALTVPNGLGLLRSSKDKTSFCALSCTCSTRRSFSVNSRICLFNFVCFLETVCSRFFLSLFRISLSSFFILFFPLPFRSDDDAFTSDRGGSSPLGQHSGVGGKEATSNVPNLPNDDPTVKTPTANDSEDQLVEWRDADGGLRMGTTSRERVRRRAKSRRRGERRRRFLLFGKTFDCRPVSLTLPRVDDFSNGIMSYM